MIFQEILKNVYLASHWRRHDEFGVIGKVIELSVRENNLGFWNWGIQR